MASSASDWTSLGLAPWLAGSCVEMGLKKPTPIQRACIGPALQGRDVVGSAETGSGKTAAFALPIIQALSEDPYGVFAVVLSPARELASQIADQFTALGSHMSVRVAVVVGGVDMMRQALELAKRPHVVIGTPGRLADHLRSSGTAVVLRNARFLVIDEADRLLELGFSADVGAIVERLPSRRQTLLFSATMSGALDRLRRLALTSPHVADLAPSERVPSALLLQYLFVPANVRDVYLVHMLRRYLDEERRPQTTVIVFTSTCKACELLACTLRALDIDCAPLHSQQPQAKRARHAYTGAPTDLATSALQSTCFACRLPFPPVALICSSSCPPALVSALCVRSPARRRLLAVACSPDRCSALSSTLVDSRRLPGLSALGRFKQGSLRVLVCTDVAARGIDIPQVGVVLNHNVPALPRDFVHRCGRTARAGRAGAALTLVSQYDVEVLLAIEAAIGRKMEALDGQVHEADVLAGLNEVASARRTALLELTDNGFLDKEKERKQKRKEEVRTWRGRRDAADATRPTRCGHATRPRDAATRGGATATRCVATYAGCRLGTRHLRTPRAAAYARRCTHRAACMRLAAHLCRLSH